MTASNELICFPVWPLPETAMGLPCNYLMGALRRTRRHPIIPLVRSKGSPPRTNGVALARPQVAAAAKKDIYIYPGCLAHVASGMFYSVVCQPTPTYPLQNLSILYTSIPSGMWLREWRKCSMKSCEHLTDVLCRFVHRKALK